MCPWVCPTDSGVGEARYLSLIRTNGRPCHYTKTEMNSPPTTKRTSVDPSVSAAIARGLTGNMTSTTPRALNANECLPHSIHNALRNHNCIGFVRAPAQNTMRQLVYDSCLRRRNAPQPSAACCLTLRRIFFGAPRGSSSGAAACALGPLAAAGSSTSPNCKNGPSNAAGTAGASVASSSLTGRRRGWGHELMVVDNDKRVGRCSLLSAAVATETPTM